MFADLGYELVSWGVYRTNDLNSYSKSAKLSFCLFLFLAYSCGSAEKRCKIDSFNWFIKRVY